MSSPSLLLAEPRPHDHPAHRQRSAAAGRARSPWLGQVVSATRRDIVGATGIIMLLGIIAAILIGPALPLPDASLPSLTDRLRPPMAIGQSGDLHLLGTDQLGRDVLARALLGGRVSLIVAASTILISGVVGTTLGLISGYRGGLFDYLTMRLVDFQMAMPSLLLAIFILYLIGTSVFNLILLLSIMSWFSYTRIIRSEVLSIKSSVYVEAARACGASDARILLRHILPQTLPVLAVVTVFDFSTVILAEAGISFLGMGVQPPDTSWGRMISEGQQYITTGSWWLFAVPGMAIFLTVLSLRLGSDWIRKLMQPGQGST